MAESLHEMKKAKCVKAVKMSKKYNEITGLAKAGVRKLWLNQKEKEVAAAVNVRKRNEKAKPLCIMSNDCVLSMF
jgi:hypothetical protein